MVHLPACHLFFQVFRGGELPQHFLVLLMDKFMYVAFHAVLKGNLPIGAGYKYMPVLLVVAQEDAIP